MDPDTQEAGVFATVKESGRQALLALRLQIQSGTKISQIEAMVARTTPGQGPFANLPPPTFTPKPVFYETVPPNERRSRAQMLAIAVSYFEGLEQATDKLTPFDPNCQRIENGMVTANNPASPAAMSKMTCGQQFATGFSPFITQIRERRFPIMDQEKGLALAQVFFDHAGVIKDGKIIRVEAVLNPVPYGMKSGW